VGAVSGARIAAALLALAGPALAQVSGEFFSGHALLQRLQASERIDRGSATTDDFNDAATARGYVVGVFDVGVGAVICPPADSKITAGQIRRMAYAYLSTNAARLHEPAYKLVLDGLSQAWPCVSRSAPSPSRSL
jgi:hypothetical protein